MLDVEDFVDEFMHYGVPGMKWGVRKSDRSKSVTVSQEPGKRVKATGGYDKAASADAKKAAKNRQVARASSVDALTNKQLKELNERMNLEQNYSRLASADAQARKSAGRKFTEKVLGQGGKLAGQQVNSLVGNVASDQTAQIAQEIKTMLNDR